MCGQCGCAGFIDYKSEQVFKKLLVFNATRGTDSTGAASVKRGLDYKTQQVDVIVAKEVGNAFNLLERRSKEYFDFSDVLSGTHRALLGHCRASTRGATTRDNAHPFVFDNIVGTHNGTIGNNSHRLLKGYLKYQTDSEAVFAEIETDGIGSLMNKLKGYKDPKSNVTCEDAYVFVWWDSRDNTINFLRNKERPLWFTFDEDHKQLFWSSEGLHLVAATGEVRKKDDDKFWELPADKHFSWVIPKPNEAFGKPRVTVRRGLREDVPFGKRNYGSQGFHSNPQYQSPSNKSSTKNSGGSGSNSTQDKSGSKGDDYGDCAATFFDKNVGFWSRWNADTRKFKFAAKENSKYYYNIQFAWDDLEASEQRSRFIRKDIPEGVILPRWRYNEQNTSYEYVPPQKAPALEALQQRNPHRDKLESEVKDRKLKEAQAGTDTKYFVERFRDDKRRMFYDLQTKKYFLYTFMGHSVAPAWDKQEFTKVPISVPFQPVDINARHCFKHKGKGKRKIIYYRGFNKDMLVKESFERIMLNGCCNCDRKPAWGNEVRFVTHDMFLCEYCQSNPDTVQQWTQAAVDTQQENKQAVN